VTTQHTDREQNDVDTTVVECSSTPDTTVDSIASETTIPVVAEVQGSPSDPAEISAETLQLPDEAHQPVSDGGDVQGQDSQAQPDAAAEAEVVQAAEAALAYGNVLPLPAGVEEGVRPFTAFIEEFRLAEAQTRLSVSLPEAASEPSNAVVEPIATPAESTALAQIQEKNVFEETGAPAPETSVPTSAPTERAISPLLRPATRLRLPRHGRHQREEAVAEMPMLEREAERAEQPTQSGAQVQSMPEEKSVLPAEPEQSRPIRRYRFDRPAASNSAATVTPPLSVAQRSEEVGVETQAKTMLSGASLAEGSPQIQEASTPPTVTMGRRRQRASSAAIAAPTATTPTAEATALAVEPVAAPTGEGVAEDLPPLEYSELQKTTSRRRRRHRSGSSNNASAPSPASELPVPQPETPAQASAPSAVTAMPQNTPGDLSANYSIVSGYTVNQMNMGNDIAGPFMGPEPSPARGSVPSRDGRATGRSEAQRTPTPLYPHKPSHDLVSGALLNQFASTIVQAFQVQTDRLVAELRRSAQAPASVSVTLPPFPSTERVGVFVDVANLLYSARTLRISVDFGKLLDFLRGNRRLVRAHAYCPTSPQIGDEQMFLQAVKGLGYRITTKNYKTFSSGAKKADLDLDLCMDVVRLVDGRSVDCVVLVSGDSDFMPMLDYCSDKGVRVEVAAFDEAMSATLRQSCDLFVNLSMLEEIRT